MLILFQSTPPVRGATVEIGTGGHIPFFQSTPPVRGATGLDVDNHAAMGLSIHAPREGGDWRARYFRL